MFESSWQYTPGSDILPFPGVYSVYTEYRLALVRARNLSTSRFLGPALVFSASSSSADALVIESTAASKAASLTFEGLLKPLTLRTYCTAAARISSCDAGGSKLNSGLIFRHIFFTALWFALKRRMRDPYLPGRGEVYPEHWGQCRGVF